MKRIALIVIALMFVPAVAFAQLKKDERDLRESGDMPLEELRREPITSELDIPYADTGNPRHRLDAALRKAGVPSYFVTVKGGGHDDFGTAADDRVEAFFDKYLRGKEVVISTEPLKKP